MKKVLLIGFGNMGRNHFRAIQKGQVFRLQALMDPMADFSTVPPDVKLARKIEELNDLNQIDAVIVSSPTESHFEVAKYFIQKGKHTLVEKPLAVNVRECQSLLAEQSRSSVKLAVGHVERHNPTVVKLMEILQSGVCGRPIHFAFKRVGYYPKNVQGGNNVVLDLAIHDLDIMSLLQGEVEFKNASGLCYRNSKIIDVCDIGVKSKEGVSATFHASWLGTEKARIIDIYCEFAQIRANLISRKCVVIKTDKSTGESIYEDYEVNADDALVSEHAAFNQLIEGKRSSICTADQGQWAVSLAEAAVNAIGSRS